MIDDNDIRRVGQDFSDILKNTGQSMTDLTEVQLAIAQNLKRQQAIQNAIAASTLKTVNGLTNFGRTLVTTTGNDFTPLNKVIDLSTDILGKMATAVPIVGGLFSGAIKAAGEVSKFLIQEFGRAYGNFEKLTDTGIVGTFEEMRNLSLETGLNYQDLTTTFGKYSTTMALYGDTVAGGRNKVSQLALASKETTKDFQLFGMNVKDVTEMQLSYIEQAQYSSKIRGLSAEQLSHKTKEYILTLDYLSKMTGVSRKELQKQFEDQTRNARYLAGTADLSETSKKEVDKTLAQLRAVDPDFAEGIQDLIASKGAPITDKAKAAYLSMEAGGMDVQAEILKLRGNGGSSLAFMQSTARSGRRYATQEASTVKYVGESNIYHKGYLAAQKLGLKTEQDLADADAKTRQTQTEVASGEDEVNKRLAATRYAMYQTGKNMQVLATSQGAVTVAMKSIAKGLNSVLSSIYSALGKAPEYITKRIEENAAMETMVASQQDVVEFETALDKNKKEIERLRTEGASRAQSEKIRALEEQNKRITREINTRRDTAAAAKLEAQRLTKEREEAERKQFGTSANAAGASTIGGSSGGGGGGVSGTSGQASGPLSSNILLKAMGAKEGGSAGYDAAFGDAKGKDGIIRNYLYPKMSSKRVMTAAEWSNGRNLSDLTIGEVFQFQNYRNSLGNFAGLGKYGFMQGTLFGRNGKGGLVSELGLDMNTKFDPSVQDRLGELLLKQNTANLQRMGLPTTPGYVYMSWYIGPGGAKAVWDAVKNGYGNLTVAQAVVRGGYGDPSPGNPELTRLLASGFEAELSKRMAEGGATAPKGRTGGIFSGPSTGYLVELHGDEEIMVIPANKGMDEFTAAGYMDDDITEDLVDAFEIMEKRIDRMISAASEQSSTLTKAKIYNV